MKEQNQNKVRNSSKKSNKLVKVLSEGVPPLLFISVLIFYFLFFVIAYFAPLLYPNLLTTFHFYNNYFKEFKDFHDHRFKNNKGEGIILLEFYAFIYIYMMLLLSYLRVSLTDPGHTPDDLIWNIKVNDSASTEQQLIEISTDLEKREEILACNRNIITIENFNDSRATSGRDQDNLLYYTTNERSEDNSVRYCLKCRKFKPDRAHHCKFCDVCVLKMDHHCPLLGNCIGYRNYKFFLLTIFYGLVNSSYFNYIFSDAIRFLVVEEKIVDLKLVAFLMLYFFMIMVMIALSIFNIFHFWITVKNFTSHEFITKVVKKKGARGDIDIESSERLYSTPSPAPLGSNHISRYDLSLWYNFKQVYGWNPIFWLLPISSTSVISCGKENTLWENGINFKINKKYEYEIVKSV